MTIDLEKFGVKTFDKKLMKKYLSPLVYGKYKEAKRNLTPLDKESADAIADAMKKWSIQNGVTHYTHWFQPMSSLSAKKHEAFIDRDEENNPILQFGYKQLIKGEPDASSFPSGGLRATFEARGYTYWDLTSQVFIKDNVLHIPSVFVSYYGEALDKKLPLLKSISAINKSATRAFKALGHDDVKGVKPVIGLEQEYFLIDEKMYQERLDLKQCQRTLFGARSSKAQEIEAHYLNVIPSRVQKFMQEVNQNLWELGIYCKTEHNEAAPCQFELAPIYSDANISIDQNIIIMEILSEIAHKHGFACLLHEKPFSYVNGSGKHNNYSLVSNTNINVFNPGKDPKNNLVFLTFITAMLKAVDKNSILLRMASSCVGNDFRLGGHEAPPAIISISLGADIEEVCLSLVEKYTNEVNEKVFNPLYNIEDLRRDGSDRNRTSPMAFTGNKFEFRMLGSSRGASTANTVLNTILAQALDEISDDIEREGLSNVRKILAKYIEQHQRILFGKDGYSENWIKEAQKRGLPNVKTYYESIACLLDQNVISMFEKYNVFTKEELLARHKIKTEEVVGTWVVEANTFISMLNKNILPNILAEIRKLNDDIKAFNSKVLINQKSLLQDKFEKIHNLKSELESCLDKLNKISVIEEKGDFVNNNIVNLVKTLGEEVSDCEVIISKQNWSLPTYEDIFNSIR